MDMPQSIHPADKCVTASLVVVLDVVVGAGRGEAGCSVYACEEGHSGSDECQSESGELHGVSGFREVGARYTQENWLRSRTLYSLWIK